LLKRILLVRIDRIGDVVLSLPAAGLIKRHYPKAEVHFLTRPYTAPLAGLASDVDQVMVDKGGGVWSLSREIKVRKYQAAVLLYPTARLAWALFLSGIPVRVGTAYRFYSFLFNRRVPLHRRESQRHELELNLELVARGLGLDGREALGQESYPQMTIDPKHREAAGAKLVLGAEKLVILHPGSGGSARDWPLRNFARLADRLGEKGLAVAVTLGPGEEKLRQEMELGMVSKPKWISNLDLAELAATLSLADLVVSNSTGPLHMAAAVGTKVLGIYCPVKPCLPRRWGPYGPGHWALIPEVPVCRKCMGASCPHWDCMESLTIEAVFAKAMEMLNKP
jgi:ADP-heptose:LPS heptosyltransferase